LSNSIKEKRILAKEKKSGKKLGTGPNLLAGAVGLYLFFSFTSISASQIFLGLALLFWLYRLVIEKKWPTFPRFFWPLGAYALLSIVSSIRSVNPQISLVDSRELLLFLIVPITYMGIREENTLNKLNLALLLSALVSIFYSLITFKPGERAAGFMGHYMTQAGLLLLFVSIALGLFLLGREKMRFFWGAALPPALLVLVLTLTRSAWIGVIVSVSVVLSIHKPKLLVLVPLLFGLIIFVSPQTVRQRALSIFDLQSASNTERIEYIKAGVKIIKNFPLFGTGPDTVDMEFQLPKYGLSDSAKQNVHLHNNIIQIAAERGLPALLAWLAFLVFACLDLIKIIKNRDPAALPLASGALAALLALFAAGLFEYNFGDSEITTLFLYLLVIPFSSQTLRKMGDAAKSKIHRHQEKG
jgi:O-antigen ligase